MVQVRRWWTVLVCFALVLGVGGRPAPARAETSPGWAPAPRPAPRAPVSLDDLAGTDWWAAMQQEIQRAEYEITWQEDTGRPGLEAAYQAPNRAHNLRTYFMPGPAIRVLPRTGAAKEWEWSLSQTGAGAHTLVAEGSRIEYRRATEAGAEPIQVYRNDERGLHQTLIVPAALGQSPELALDLAIGGDLAPHLVEEDASRGAAIEFAPPGGAPVLRYGEWIAHDAAGRPLSVRLSLASPEARPPSQTHESPLAPHALRLTVDAAGAAYPITVQSLLTSPTGVAEAALSDAADWTADGDQAGSEFGFQAITAGDVNGDGYSDLVVGAPLYDSGQGDAGKVYVYHGSQTGLGTSPQWTAASSQAGAAYGRAVGTAGDVNGDGYADIIVGAYRYDVWSGGSLQQDAGRVFVYTGSATGISTSTPWSASNNHAEAYFGRSVSTAGDVNGDGYSDVIVGAPEYSNGQEGEGWAAVYLGSASGLDASPHWSAESDQAGAWFGVGVGTAGDVNGDGYADVAVGAERYNGPREEGGGFDGGRITVYHGSPSGSSPTASWTAYSDQSGALFGAAAITAGDVNGDGYADLVAGAPMYDAPVGGGTLRDAGRATVYHGSPTGLGTSPRWTKYGSQERAMYGVSAGTAGDVNGDGYADLVVGAFRYDNLSAPGQPADAGRATLHLGSAAGLGARPHWTVQGDQAGALMGRSVGTAGDVNGDGYSDLAVGALWYDGPSGQDSGRVTVYYGRASGLAAEEGTAVAAWSASGDQAGGQLGYSLNAAGDVNGDGFADLAVGAHGYDNGQGDAGRAYVFYGRPDGLGTSPGWTTQGDQAGAWYGWPVGTAGDVNGDGYDDLVVGAHRYDDLSAPGQATNQGRATVYHGGPNGLSQAPAWVVTGDQADAYFGQAAGTAGDVNGDGYADLVVGAYLYDGDLTDAGRAYLYLGGPAGLGTSPQWSVDGGSAGAWLGSSLGTAGDVNGDGFADVAIGAQHYANGQVEKGWAGVFHGSQTGLGTSPDWTVEGDQAGANYGYPVGTAGDVNGDGYADLAVGAGQYNAGYAGEGRATVYHGGPNGLSQAAAWQVYGGQVGVALGHSLGAAGDVNGDGYADLVVGAWNVRTARGAVGRATVYHGSESGLAATPAWTAYGTESGARFGWAVGTSGDVNGDGYADLAVGAPAADSSRGAVGVYYGGGGPGLALNPRQRRSDDSAPVARLGNTGDRAFLLALRGRTPYGRGKVKLEWEVKPLGVPLDGTGTQQSATWSDTGTAGVELDALASDLQVQTPYHWRVRLRYHPVTTPVQGASRWLTMPWNGWQEQDLRTGGRAAKVGFENLQLRVYEDAQFATVAVTLDGPADREVRVRVQTADGTAQAPGDYQSIDLTLVFAPGVTSRTVQVPIVEDALPESDETLQLTLSEPLNAVLDEARHPATLTIVDTSEPPPQVGFERASYSVSEGAGVAMVRVTLDKSSDRTVLVDFTTSDGTAQAPDDYTTVSVTLVFAPGATVQTLAIPIAQDELMEGDELLVLILSNEQNVRLDPARTPAMLTILDDERNMIYLPAVFSAYP